MMEFITPKGEKIVYPDIHEREFAEIIKKFGHLTLTIMNGVHVPYALFKAIEYIISAGIPGDVVECGVWRGGSAAIAAESLVNFGDTTRNIYLYDTFDGMPEPDAGKDGLAATATWNHHRSLGGKWGFGGSEDEVRDNISQTRYPSEKFVFVKGMVENTIAATAPKAISILRLDTDLYSSTKYELENLFPLLSVGGVIIIDDYGLFDGCRAAVDEYIRDKKLRLMLARIDDSARLAVKCEG